MRCVVSQGLGESEAVTKMCTALGQELVIQACPAVTLLGFVISDDMS